jgi:hypothetical protein
MARAVAAMGSSKRNAEHDGIDEGLTLEEMNQLAQAEKNGSVVAKPPEPSGGNEDIKFDFLEFMNIYNLEKSGKHKGHGGVSIPEASKVIDNQKSKPRPKSPNQAYKLNAVQE